MRHDRLAPVAFAAIALLATPASADSAWTIPGIVNAAGLNGTHFVSDLTLTNPGGAVANVTLSFFPAGASVAKNLTLNPGQTVVFSDVAGATFGISGGAGALSVTSNQPLLIRAKTYNTAASGTYGVALPVVTSDRLLGAGDVGDSLWISQDSSGNAGYRTNIALVFPDASGGAATVTVYDADGNATGSQDFGLDAPGLQQFSVGSFAGAVSVGRAQVAVTRGHASAYAVVVDNVTGDSSLFSFEDLPAGIQDVLVNGVARASGRNNAFFRTDGRFYNPTDTDATVTVAFHASGNANPTPKSTQFVLPAGKIRDVVDVLSSLLNLPIGSAGALRFQSNWPVAILCRTSNVDPSGARPGTFGSQQKPVPLLSFVNSADAGAAVTGIRQDGAFRTNVGFAAGGDGASYTLTLRDASGATVATTSASLGAFGWTQPGIQDLFPATTIPQNATLNVKVTAGSLDVFDSSIDNLSGDPVVTPIAPLPAAIPSGATIGPAGGSIRSDDGRLTLRVPAGALSQPVTLSFQSTSTDAPLADGSGYQILPAGTSFSKTAVLTLAYGAHDTEGSSAGALTIASNAGTGWFALGGGSVDPARHTLSVPLDSTSPAPPASAGLAGRNALAPPGANYFAIIWSWQFNPIGMQTIFVDQDVDLWVNFVGYSSSLIETSGRLFLSSSPAKVEVSFVVNGKVGGRAGDGVVLSTSSTTGTYIAPSCPPPKNPVFIYATIANKTGFDPPYRPFGGLHVRVLSRKWRLYAVPDYTQMCGVGHASVADHIVFAAASAYAEFTLNDSFHGTVRTALGPPAHALGGCDPCGGNKFSFTPGTADSPMQLDVTADWSLVDDAMGLQVLGSYPGIGGCVDHCTTPQGDTADVPVPAFADSFRLQAKGLMDPGQTLDETYPGLQNPGTLKVHYILQALCP